LRHPPLQPGPRHRGARIRGLEPQLAAQLLGAVGQVAQAAAPAAFRDAGPVVDHLHGQHPVGSRVHGHVDLAGACMPGRVGQRLAQRGQGLLGDLRADGRAEARAQPQ
jgi:hypothetical protein